MQQQNVSMPKDKNILDCKVENKLNLQFRISNLLFDWIYQFHYPIIYDKKQLFIMSLAVKETRLN